MIAITIIISLTYFLLIFFFILGFRRIKEFKSLKSIENISFSIVIPFRNEAENLPELLRSIAEIDYPTNKFEIIFVNDDSIDHSVEIIEKFKIQNLPRHAMRQEIRQAGPKLDLSIIHRHKKSNSPKKDAIDLAIKQSKFDWIITTDADCVLPSKWLEILNDFVQSHKPKMIVMPVSFETENNILDNFQILELLSLQGATIGGFGIKHPFLCNGANLCYEKNFFLELDGFSGNDNIASGDDVFMLEKMLRKFPNKVKYLKSKGVIVRTKVEKQFSDMIHQRIRWAAKTTSIDNSFGKLVGLVVLLMNFWLILLLLFAIFNTISWQHFGYVFFIKFIIDLLLLIPTAVFFQQQKLLKSYLMVSFLYPFFNVYVAILSFGKSYDWKGRTFSK